MSAMSRLATDIALCNAGLLTSADYLAVQAMLIRLGYEPADDVTELDVPDELAVIAECVEYDSHCTGSDYVAFMVADGDGWACPNCNAAQQSDYESYLSATRGY